MLISIEFSLVHSDVRLCDIASAAACKCQDVPYHSLAQSTAAHPAEF